MLNLIHARTFLSVLEHRGIRRAARNLGLSSSTVVDHIDRLEIELGARLLVRERGKVEPTAQGAQLVPYTSAKPASGVAKVARPLVGLGHFEPTVISSSVQPLGSSGPAHSNTAAVYVAA